MKDGVDSTATESMRELYGLPMRLTVHHPKINVPVLWWRSVGSTHTAFVMETLLDDIAHATNQDPVAYRMQLFGDNHPRHRDALQLAVDKSGYGKTALPEGRAWGVAVHESFDALFEIEAECTDTERALRETVQEMRSVEGRLAKLPKMSHVDLVKSVIRANRRGPDA